MTQRKKHTQEEIAAKLAQARELATHGRLQSEIAGILGVSVMTLHRWRKAILKPALSPSSDETVQFERELGATLTLNGSPNASPVNRGFADLHLENSRLRRLVTDLLLEKMKLVEEMQRPALSVHGVKRA